MNMTTKRVKRNTTTIISKMFIRERKNIYTQKNDYQYNIQGKLFIIKLNLKCNKENRRTYLRQQHTKLGEMQ